MPSLTTGELVAVLQTKNLSKFQEISHDPLVLMHEIGKFLQKNKDLPAGLTISAVSDALEDIASREFGAKRSACWAKARKSHLKRQPECQACGQTGSVSVHHCRSFHTRPDLECDVTNLITLCEKSDRFGFNCHLVIGHCGDWGITNPGIHRCIQAIRGTWHGK
jgi:hypothetical protein